MENSGSKFTDKTLHQPCQKCGMKEAIWSLRARQHKVCEDCRMAIEWRETLKPESKVYKWQS